MQPTPRRPNETEEEYNARVAALSDWIHNGGAAAYVKQARREGRVTRAPLANLDHLIDALIDQHPEFVADVERIARDGGYKG